MPVALTIAGSDPSGGAGVQADLKTFAAFEVYGATVITAVTAQNTLGVTHVEALAPAVVVAQMDAVVTDLHPAAVKTGMLANAAIIEVVADRISAYGRTHGLANVVVDPVMVAKSGARLLRDDALDALRSRLLPLARVVTPNADEAAALAGHPVTHGESARRAARIIHALGPRYVVVKGGHFGSDATDVLFDGERFTAYRAERIVTLSTHGTGCTFASAITACLAKGMGVEEAVAAAKEYVTQAIVRAFPLGAGHGPLNHFYRWWTPG